VTDCQEEGHEPLGSVNFVRYYLVFTVLEVYYEYIS
jgi:hypothetical protein